MGGNAHEVSLALAKWFLAFSFSSTTPRVSVGEGKSPACKAHFVMAEVQRKAHRTQLVCVYVPPPLLAAFSATTWATGKDPATAACSTHPRWVLGCSGVALLRGLGVAVQWGCSGAVVALQWGAMCSGTAAGSQGVRPRSANCMRPVVGAGTPGLAPQPPPSPQQRLAGLRRHKRTCGRCSPRPLCNLNAFVCCPVQVHPGLFAAASPWLGGEDFKDLMLQVGGC